MGEANEAPASGCASGPCFQTSRLFVILFQTVIFLERYHGTFPKAFKALCNGESSSFPDLGLKSMDYF